MISPNNSNNLFTASEYAPNPASTMYWIDLSQNTRGNVIKTYDGKNWLPLNRAANVDQWTHITEIVKAAGINFSETNDMITFPSNKSNHYFKGKNLTDTIEVGDQEVYDEITALWKKLNSVDQYVEEIDAFSSTPDKVTLNAKLWAATDEEEVYTEESTITQDIPVVSENNAGIVTSTQYTTAVNKDKEHDTKIASLETRVGTLETDVDTLEGKVSTLESKVNTLESSVSTLQGQVKTLQDNYNTLNSQYSSLASRVAALESQPQASSGSSTGGSNTSS